MVLSGTKKTSSLSSLINQSQGGGSKKAGFPYMIGRIHGVSLALGATAPVSGLCMTLKCSQTSRFPNAHITRNLGRNMNAAYWSIPGTGQ